MGYNNKMSKFLRHPNDHPFNKYTHISEKVKFLTPGTDRGIKKDFLKMDISKHNTQLTCKIYVSKQVLTESILQRIQNKTKSYPCYI